MPDCDRLFTFGAKFGNEFADAIIQVEQSTLPELGNRDGGKRLSRTEPEIDRVGGHGHAGTRLAQRHIRDDLTMPRNVQLSTKVNAVRNALLENRYRARK